MDCEKVIAQLSDFYDGELSKTLEDEVKAHVVHCSECASELASFEAICGMLKSNEGATSSACKAAPSWDQFASRLEVFHPASPARTAIKSRYKIASIILVGAGTLAASILFIFSLYVRTNSDSVAHDHNHSHTASTAIVIDFEQLLHDESNQPMATLDSLSNRFDGQEAGVDESESQLGYKPSISQALPSGVNLVSNRILKLPQCSCAAGACSCGPAGCNCAASLCKRVDGTEFLIVEHCATQNVSFGELKSELVQDKASEVQLMNTGKRLIASWITDHRRLTAIGLNDKAEAYEIVAGIAYR